MFARLAGAALMIAWCGAAAEPAREAASVITGLAAALTAGNVQEFMAPFDRSVPQYDSIQANVTALAAQGDTQSYLEITKNEGDERARTLEISWELRLTRASEALPYARRQTNVTCKLELRGKQWRIVAFQPAEFLAP